MFKFSNIRNRPLEDQLLLIGSGMTFIFLLPFSLYRLFIGDLMLAAIDFTLALLMLALCFQAWREKKVAHLNIIAVFAFMVGISSVMYLKGVDLIFWAFPAMGAAYFLLNSCKALMLNTIFIAGITLLFLDKLTKPEVMSFYPSLILVCLFGFIFGLRSERQNNKLQKLVSEDTLTRVKNRRSFDEKIEEILANNKRYPKPISMLLLDLDKFKKINDSHGHKQGDQVLINFAKLIKSKIRETDFIYRFGGEEFVVIAKNSSLEDSGNLAESLRKFVQKSPELSRFSVTVSIGVSEIMPMDDANSWFRRCDLALYESKTSGRNTVRIAKLEKNGTVTFKALSKYRNIKLLSPKTNNLICPLQNDNHHAYQPSRNSQFSIDSSTINSQDNFE